MYQNYGTLSPLKPDSSRAGLQTRASGCLPCSNCLVTVPQDRYYAVESYGKFQSIMEPGFAFVGFDLCGCCITLRSITSRVEQNECWIETKTKDNVFVMVKVAVQQSVIPKHVKSAIYTLTDVGAQVDSYVADVVRSHVPKMTLDEAFEHKDAISVAIQEELTKHMLDYGFMIHKALVVEVKPSQEVMHAMNEINKQKRLRDAAVMAAEADKIRVVVKAEAECDAARLQGEGIAKQREAIVQGLKRCITEGTDEKLSSGMISELLLITQYFETLKEIGASAKSQAVFIPHGPTAGLSDIAAQLRNGMLQAKAVESPAQVSM